MRYLVADIGGTNMRVALADETRVLAHTVRNFYNRDYAAATDVIALYQKDAAAGRIDGCCIAVAGPVTSYNARLTNMDWSVEVSDISRRVGTDRVVLLNDLAALGNSVGGLGREQIIRIKDGDPDSQGNDQLLIVGIGTGFNVCAVKHVTGNQAVCLAAESGHCSLSAELALVLQREFGAACHGIQSVEQCFAGRGLSHLYLLASGDVARSGAEITQSAATKEDPIAERVMGIYMELLSILSRELFFQYLPLNGVYFAGSVSRGIFGGSLAPEFGLNMRTGGIDQQFQDVPLSLINDDAAGLVGCHKVLCA